MSLRPMITPDAAADIWRFLIFCRIRLSGWKGQANLFVHNINTRKARNVINCPFSPQTVSGCRRQPGASAQPSWVFVGYLVKYTIFWSKVKKNIPGWGTPGGTWPSGPSRCISRWRPLLASHRWPSPSVGRTVGCKALRFHWLEAPADDMCHKMLWGSTSRPCLQSKVRSKVDFRCRLWWLSINQSHKLVIFNADFICLIWSDWYLICWS